MSAIHDDFSDYPMGTQQVPKRTVVLRGKWRGRPKLITMPIADTITMRELTPPVQTDEERGQGDSTNAKLHRLLYSKSR